MKGYFWCCNTILLVTSAQLSLKLGINILEKVLFFNEKWKSFFWIIKNLKLFIPIFIGLFLYLVSMIAWLFTLNFLTLSKSYLLMSLSYILVYLISINLSIFNETGSIKNFIGVLLILIGIFFNLKNKN